MRYQATSAEAWESFRSVTGCLDKQIVSALINSPDGLICQEIERDIGRIHQAVSGNLRHLVERGVITGTERRRKTYSGRDAIVWKLVLARQIEMFP